jgi:hypothetical protein
MHDAQWRRPVGFQARPQEISILHRSTSLSLRQCRIIFACAPT